MPRRRSDLSPGRWIGRQHSLSDTAIRKRAKANGWTRDLSSAVRSRVRESLGRAGVRANLLGGVTLRGRIVNAAARGVRWSATPARHRCAAGGGRDTLRKNEVNEIRSALGHRAAHAAIEREYHAGQLSIREIAASTAYR
jgi:hypothetical protein